MKARLNTWLMAGLMATAIFACKKETKEIGAPASKVEGIKASWTLSKCVHVDEVSLIKESANITTFFAESGKMPNITFTDSTYAVDTAGLKINFFNSTDGTWAFDNVSFPSKVIFTPTVGDKFEFKLNGPIRPQDNLKFTKPIYQSCKGKNTHVMSYNLEFVRK